MFAEIIDYASLAIFVATFYYINKVSKITHRKGVWCYMMAGISIIILRRLLTIFTGDDIEWLVWFNVHVIPLLYGIALFMFVYRMNDALCIEFKK